MFANSESQQQSTTFFDTTGQATSVIVEARGAQVEARGSHIGEQTEHDHLGSVQTGYADVQSQQLYGSPYFGAGTPITPSYSGAYAMPIPLFFSGDWNFNMTHRHAIEDQYLPSCSYEQRNSSPQFTFQQQSPADSTCSGVGGQIQSPTLALGNRLNPLTPSGFSYPRYDWGGPLMGAQRKTGGRRPRECDMADLDDGDDAEKKIKRRQRNKEAAARCRQRRLDLMNTLQEQVDHVKAENDRKEQEIRAMREKMQRMETFLRTHDCKFTREEIEALPILNTSSGISTSVKREGYHSSVTVTSSQPAYSTSGPLESRKRPLPVASSTSSMSDFDTADVKIPKVELDRTLADVNGDHLLNRPNTLDIDGSSVRSGQTIPLSTPSNFGTYGQSFTNNFALPSFGMGDANLFLNQPTGLTPCGAPSVGFVNTPTPLQQNSDAELRPL